MPRLLRAALAALSVAALVSLPSTVHASNPPKVAIVVGPVGSLTPTYLALAELAAATAQRHGATVARAYSPHATPANVLAAVADASVVIYFGHGYGHPSPYGGLNTAKQNGWALQGPAARGTHSDASGQIAYYGEDWIVANARPAPGFVMIYSNTCYAPGASEGGHPEASASQAAQRVAYYSRSTFELGGAAYFATDFDRGAADLLDRLLANRSASFARAFTADHRYVPSGLSIQAHHFSAGQQIWLHRSKYTDGPPNYWYAFAGNPDLTPIRAWDRVAPSARLLAPEAEAVEVQPEAAIKVEFSEAVAGVSSSTLSLREVGGAVVPAQLTYDAGARVATIRPESALELSRRYEVVANGGIIDAAGRPIEPVTWAFSTRLDADPLFAGSPVVFEAGAHELMRFAPDGSVAEARSLEVQGRYWVTGDRRARIRSQPGSWLRVRDGDLAGWWVAESGAAHALGHVEEAILSSAATIALGGQHAILGFGMDGPQATELSIGGSRQVSVDRRRVFDGRTYLRLADTEYVGAWIEADPSVWNTEPMAQRILARETRAATVTMARDPGEREIVRFDASGRVVDRRTLSELEMRVFDSAEVIIVGGARFHVVAGGALSGWSLADDGAVRVLTGSAATPLE